MFSLNHIHTITIQDVPLQWMTRIELFSSDLEQFPLMYVHILADKGTTQAIGNYNPDTKQRIFGYALSAKWGELKSNGLCNVDIAFICNIPQNYSPTYDTKITKELSHRIGIADKVSFDDLSHICANSPESLPLLEKIWSDKIEAIYGKYLPHGRIFDEMYGIIRFSASGNAPKLGKTSEYRMLYWYMKDLGERINYNDSVNQFKFLEFYIIPTYEELLTENFRFFDTFQEYFISTKFFWELEYTKNFTVNGHQFKYADKSTLPIKPDVFIERYTASLGNHYDNISKLRQIYNRMPGRLYGYIWNLMTPTTTDFKSAFENRDAFKEFYRDHSNKKGSSSKVIACFLQQAFGIEAFPIDTWVKTFIFYPLGVSPKDDGHSAPSKAIQNDLYEKYNRLDKLEKIIWASSMGNKTNKTEFLDILWCQRYGTDLGSKGPCRGANPLSCLQCTLKDVCLAYDSIKEDRISISANEDLLKADMKDEDLFFGILTNEGTPRKVFTRAKGVCSERDNHSGLDLPRNLQVEAGMMTVNEFIDHIQNSSSAT